MRKLLILTAVVLSLSASFSSLVHAEEAGSRDYLKSVPGPRNWLYFGFNGGYSKVNVDSSVRESDKNGYQLNFKILGSRYYRDWVADLGAGYFYNSVSGDDLTSVLRNAEVVVRTRAGFVEFSPRYRFNERWQLGPVVNALFGTDVSFDESESQNNKNLAFIVGPRVQYEIGTDTARWRFGLQAMTDLNIEKRGVYLVQADIQFGIPFLNSDHSAPPPAPVAAPLPPRPQAPKFAEIMPDNNVKIYLGEAVLRFRTAQSNLRPSSREILAKISKYLVKSKDLWEHMRVEGHADRRGKLNYNMKLSRARADTVLKELARLGVEKKKLKAEGFGPNRPIDPADDLEAYALNRRVEIWLDGVSDPATITRDLNELH